MEKPDNDNGKRFHITLNAYDRSALRFMQAKYGASAAGAIRASLRAAAIHLGFKPPESKKDDA